MASPRCPDSNPLSPTRFLREPVERERSALSPPLRGGVEGSLWDLSIRCASTLYSRVTYDRTVCELRVK